MQTNKDTQQEIDTKPYWVSGNLDQIQKHGFDKNHSWSPLYTDKIPNRVVCKFSNKLEACEMYNNLWRMRLVAFRNWLD